jgi:hypothetical protein
MPLRSDLGRHGRQTIGDRQAADFFFPIHLEVTGEPVSDQRRRPLIGAAEEGIDERDGGSAVELMERSRRDGG